MSSVFAHALAGATAVTVTRNRFPGLMLSAVEGYCLGAVVGALPDIDVPLAILARKMGYPSMFPHRGWTHSLLFALFLAFFLTILLWKRLSSGRRLLLFSGLFLTALLHPVMDWMMGCGPPVPFLWPFVDKGWLCPVQLVPTAYYSSSLKGLLALLRHGPTLWGLFFETGLFLPLFLLADRELSGVGRLGLLLVSLVFSLLTLWFYR